MEANTRTKLSVLMLDGESNIALEVARCLARVPYVKLHVLSEDPWAPMRLSRHRHTFQTKHVGKNDAERLASIRQAVKRTGADVILPVMEPAVRFVAAHRQALSEITAVPPTPPPEVFDIVTNKRDISDFMVKHSIPGQPTVLPITSNGSFESNLKRLPFPALLKPVKAQGGEGIRYFDNPDLLKSALTKNRHSFSQYILQSFIPGRDIDCSVLCQEGKILAYTIQQGFMSRTEKFAPAAGVEFVENQQVLSAASELISKAKWGGVAHLDFRYDSRDNQPKLIDFNGRFWGSLVGSLVAGVNFPYLACLAALNIPFPLPKYHLRRFMASSFAVKQFLQKISGRNSYAVPLRETGLPYDLADPLSEAVKRFRNHKHRLGLKKNRPLNSV